MKHQSHFRWPRLTRMPLALEITLVLIIKFAILFLIWKTFFSQPQAKKMLVPMPQIEQHLLSIPVNKPNINTSSDQLNISPSHLTQEKKNGSN